MGHETRARKAEPGRRKVAANHGAGQIISGSMQTSWRAAQAASSLLGPGRQLHFNAS